MAGSEAVMMSCELRELGPVSEIKKLLECPICKGVPLPPIWTCSTGHIACDQCRSQLNECGLCRAPFSGGRNYFMEEIVNECTVTCPFEGQGCNAFFKANYMKTHAGKCRFGPKIKWITCQVGRCPPNAVKGGHENGVELFVIRAPHMGSHTPGKMYEFAPPGIAPLPSNASLAWGGGERFKNSYEVLVAPARHVNWIPSQDGNQVVGAIPGGISETGETLYIGRFIRQGNLINGKIHSSHGCCYIGVDGQEIASKTYEILVKVDQPVGGGVSGVVEEGVRGDAQSDNNMPAYYS